MNRIKALALALLCGTAVGQAQEEIVTVHTNDGASTVYKVEQVARMTTQTNEETLTIHTTDGATTVFSVASIDSMTFGIKEPLVLKNQYAIDEQVSDIRKIEEVDAVDGFLSYNIYGESTKAVIQVRIPNNMAGKTIDLATATAEECLITCVGCDTEGQATGTLKISKDKFGKNLTVALKAAWAATALEVAYTGAFETTYAATNSYRIAATDETLDEQKIRTVFKHTDATGGATTFVLSATDTTEPGDLSTEDYAIWFSLSASTLHKGTIDLATNTNSYTLRLLDYTTGKVIEADEKTTGAITTYASTDGDDGKIFFRINATLADGTTLEAEYWGTTTEVDDLSAALPIPQKVNSFSITSPAGEVTSYAELATIQVREKGEMTYFYFMKDLTDSPDDQFLTPMVAIKTSLINTGVIDLPTAEANTWAVSYQSIQLTSPDNEWMNKATNGTLSVSYDGETYTIELTLLDSYYTPWNTSSVTGSMNELNIYYVGSASAYSGSK